MKAAIVDFLKEEYENLRIDLNEMKDNTMQESDIVDLQDKNLSIVDEINANVQYNWRNCLLWHGILGLTEHLMKEDTDKAVIAVFHEKLKIHVDQSDIDRSHRLNECQDISNAGEMK